MRLVPRLPTWASGEGDCRSLMACYTQMLCVAARRKGVTVTYSQPEVVSGGSCPPPSTIYPGRSCYMVTLALSSSGSSRAEYHGFGPTPGVARRSAEMQAFRALNSCTRPAEGADDWKSSDDDSGSELELDFPVSLYCGQIAIDGVHEVVFPPLQRNDRYRRSTSCKSTRTRATPCPASK